MIVNYSADVEHLDASVVEAAAERPGKPIRVRIQPTLFRLREGETTGSGHYRAWADVSWILECADVEETVQVRDALRTFFDCLAKDGPEFVRLRLTAPEANE